MSRESYELHPYPTAPHIETHPSTMQTVATLYGLNPPPIETARVLELGCATGGNIVPMACALPDATFIGIDYSPRQIEQARKYADGVGATNLSLKTISLLDVGKDFGKFDYIIAHGLYSWVPDDVREKVLSICSENLTDNGVAIVSFNCQPGWHTLQWLREFVLRTAKDKSLDDIRSSIDRVLESPRLQQLPIGPALKRIAAEYKSADATQWRHDLLEADNHPFYFGDFVHDLHRHGLAYAADALSNGSHVEDQMPALKSLLDSGGDDWIKREQTLDFIRNTSFRRPLIVRKENAPSRQMSVARFGGLFVTSAMQSEHANPNLADGSVVRFRERRGAGIATGSPLTKTALTALNLSFPEPIRLPDLLARSAGSLQLSDEQLHMLKARTINELLFCWMNGVVQAYVTPPALAGEIDERPQVWKVTRYQASVGQSLLTNLRHEVINLDANDRTTTAIIRALDGTRTREKVAGETGASPATIDAVLQRAVRYGVLMR